MDVVGLDRALADRYPSQLSGGQQQRVGVARGLAADPNILLMDEPFGAVDPIVRAELQQEVLRLQRELDKTIVFVTHDIDEAFLLGDQVVILEKGGRIVQQGTPERDPREPGRRLRRDVRRRRARQAPPHRPRRCRRAGDDRVLVDAGGYPAGVIAAPGGKLAVGARQPQVAQHLEQDGSGGRRLMVWLWNNLGLVLGLAADHARLSAIPILVGFAVSIPLGWFASRFRVARGDPAQRLRHPVHDPVARALRRRCRRFSAPRSSMTQRHRRADASTRSR